MTFTVLHDNNNNTYLVLSNSISIRWVPIINNKKINANDPDCIITGKKVIDKIGFGTNSSKEEKRAVIKPETANIIAKKLMFL